ncbi:IclR family transcriptional regulator [Achromobacter veterisilvae]|jgi:DNA-binding IclR family transcriptional regulator|uniref:IclR family transcriptional regulator n=1 Tax=Achromobacter veterisilvae TaxID=2069367 RepID=A0ABZ2S8B3_9BURK
MTKKIQRGVASVEVAGAILQILRGSARSMELRELALIGGLSASRLHHYLVSLVRLGLVHRDPATARYELGPFAMELGLVAADELPAQHASAPWLRKLSEETGESSFFAVPSPRGALIVRWEQGAHPLTVHARLGTIMPILTSATGLIWLAFAEQQSRAVFEGELRRVSPAARKKVQRERLAQADEVRRQGMAAARGTMIANVNAVACPVMGRSGALIGILTVLGLGPGFDSSAQGDIAKRLRHCALAFGSRQA